MQACRLPAWWQEVTSCNSNEVALRVQLPKVFVLEHGLPEAYARIRSSVDIFKQTKTKQMYVGDVLLHAIVC